MGYKSTDDILMAEFSFLNILNSKEKFGVILILIMAIGVSILEVISASVIATFLTLLTNGAAGDTNVLVSIFVPNNAQDSYADTLLVTGTAVILALLFTAIFRILLIIYQGRFYELVRSDLSIRLFWLYLRQPYNFFTSTDPDTAARNLLNEVDFFVGRALMPLTTAIVNAVTALALLIYLIFLTPEITIIALFMFVGVYALLFFGFRNFLKKLGDERSVANTERFRIVNEAFSAIKFLKITGTEQLFSRRFEIVSGSIANNLFLNNVIAQFPKSIFEVLGFGGIIAVAIWTAYHAESSSTETVRSPLSLIGAMAYILYRLLPALQNAYQNYTSFNFAKGISTELSDVTQKLTEHKEIITATPAHLNFAGDLKLHDVSLSYKDSAKRPALRDISLTIKRGQSVGICGRSGSGKTSLLDLITGLITPDQGEITRNLQPLNNSTLVEWRNSIGYAPQETVLINGTIVENIIFHRGIGPEDELFAKDCARLAQLENFVLQELPDGYNTLVGGSGVRLSGGQKQRIGIARALFQRPSMLVLDEATSALDDITETQVVMAIQKEFSDISVILVTHRVRALQNFDSVIILDDGQIIERGTYQELAKRSSIFQKLGAEKKNEE